MPWLHGLGKPGISSKKSLIVSKINLSQKVPNVLGMRVKNCLKILHIQDQPSGGVLLKKNLGKHMCRNFYSNQHAIL